MCLGKITSNQEISTIAVSFLRWIPWDSRGTNPTPVEAIDGLVSQWAAGGLSLGGESIVSAVADHSVCTQVINFMYKIIS
jgi:hypothetical protein